MAQTMRAAHPDFSICAVVVDEPPPGFDAQKALSDFDKVIEVAALGIPAFRCWMFKHDKIDACTAVKPLALQYLLRDGFDAVIYMSPNTAVFHPLLDLIGRMATTSIILAPQRCKPCNDLGRREFSNRAIATRAGVFDSGFMLVQNDHVGNSFASWWAKQAYEAHSAENQSVVWLNQFYLDVVPGMFDAVHIERDPGIGVGYWNVDHKIVRFDKGNILVNGSPLKTFRFSQLKAIEDVAPDLWLDGNLACLELLLWYRRKLASAAVSGVPLDFWSYGKYSTLEPIPKEVRDYYAAHTHLQMSFDDPFEARGNSLYRWISRHAAATSANEEAAAPAHEP